jgi:hypothetical protein
MQISTSEQDVAACRDGARRRYRNRPLLCSLSPASADGPAQLLGAGGFNVSASGPVDLGRALLLKLRDPDGGDRRTFLARVAGADRLADGSWLVCCRFAGTPRREGESDSQPGTLAPAGEAASRPLLAARAAS